MNDYVEPAQIGPGLRGIPRLDPTNGFAEYSGDFDPTNPSYLASCVFMGIVGYAMCIVTVVFMLLLIAFKILRKLFSCCCPIKPPKPPSTKTVVVTNIVALIFTGICAIGCFLVFAGSPEVLDGAGGVTGALLDGVEPLQDDLEFIGSQMDIAASYGLDTGMGGTFATLSESLDPVMDQVNEMDKTIEANVASINQAFLGCSAVYLVICVLGALAGWKKMGFLLYILFFISFFLLFSAWLLFGLSMTISQLIVDLCDAVKEFVKAPEESDLSAMMPCMDQEAAEEMGNEFRSAIVTGYADPACPPINIDGTPYDCPPGMVASADDTFREDLIAKIVEDGQGFISEADAAATADPIADINEGAKALLAALPPIQDLAQCTFVYETFVFIHKDACKPMRKGLDLIYPGLCLISVGFNAMWIIYLVWAKRASAKPASEVEMA